MDIHNKTAQTAIMIICRTKTSAATLLTAHASNIHTEIRAVMRKLYGHAHSLTQKFSDWRQSFKPPVPDFSHGIICMRSYFNGSSSQAYSLRRSWTVASASVCAALALSVALVNSTFCLGLYLHGQEIGKAGNIAEVEKIVSGAEEQLSEILGHEYSLSDSVTLGASLRGTVSDSHDVEKALISSIGGVDEKYVLVVDGEVVGASDAEETLSEILDGVLSEYTSDATSSVRFVDDVAVVRQFVSDDVVSDPDIIKTLIAPENDESEYSLAVENVESTLVSEEIPYEVEYIEDDTLYDDESKLIEKGESGINLVTEQLVIINGVEQSREREGEMIAKEPVTEVIAVGTVPRPSTASFGSYIWPAEGIITSYFGYRSTAVGSTDHKGLDIAGSYGQDIFAADGGEVIFAGWKKAYGYMVQIRHDNGEETVYGHNSELLVSEGDRVARGDKIALMGSTGLSTGVHCHFEIRIDGTPVDPQKYLG